MKTIGLVALGVWLAIVSGPVPRAARTAEESFADLPSHLTTRAGIHAVFLQADGTWLARIALG